MAGVRPFSQRKGECRPFHAPWDVSLDRHRPRRDAFDADRGCDARKETELVNTNPTEVGVR
jgi:hypothetical protein